MPPTNKHIGAVEDIQKDEASSDDTDNPGNGFRRLAPVAVPSSADTDYQDDATEAGDSGKSAQHKANRGKRIGGVTPVPSSLSLPVLGSRQFLHPWCIRITHGPCLLRLITILIVTIRAARGSGP
jgi:hypothetical protein